MTAPTPGQRTPGELAYDAYRETARNGIDEYWGWFTLTDEQRAAWEAAAQAAIAAQQPQPAPEMQELLSRLHALRYALTGAAASMGTGAVSEAYASAARQLGEAIHGSAEPQPAPELAAAMAENRVLRDSLIEAMELARGDWPMTASGRKARKRNLDAIVKRCGLPS